MWTLADALVAGDREGAPPARSSSCASQGERLPACSTAWSAVARRGGDRGGARRRAGGRADQEGPAHAAGYAADRLIADVGRREADAYRRALELMADLELESRGGRQVAVASTRTPRPCGP